MAHIERLSQDVVNRIAAGEVVHRPVNALKELLENSLDAGATNVVVTVSQGGLKLLQIQDNGRGIQCQDLEIVCERFTTSKLKKFEDLQDIKSFGFRGEALASISHVAHVTITSKTADQLCAYKASYRDGKLVAKKPGESKDPKPCAGKNGTQILVEDLFYNLSTRKQALKNASEQYTRILDVVQKYAIHFGAKGVGFVCKKYRDSACGVNTMQSSSQLDVIRLIYGSKIAKELSAFELTKHIGLKDLQHQVYGYISNASYHLRKSNFILFINDRLVECPALKRACEYVYSLYLPKHTHPFIYLSMELPPRNIDVNIHPTKREVHFLHEEDIVDSISQAIEKQLKGSNESRSFSVRSITAMLGASSANNDIVSTKQRRRESAMEQEAKEQTESSDEDCNKRVQESESRDEVNCSTDSVKIDLRQKPTPPSKQYQSALAPQRLVRTDHRSNTIDKYCFLESQKTQLSQHSQPCSQKDGCGTSPDKTGEFNETSDFVAAKSFKLRKRKLSEAQLSQEPEPEDEHDRRGSLEATQTPQMLSSVQNLLSLVRQKKSNALARLFREHSFVGIVDKQFSLLQYRTKLYIVRHNKIAFHVFYQQVLLQFGATRPITLQTPLAIFDLVLEALKNPRNGYDEEDGPREQLADEIKTLLVSNGPMLFEYFSLNINLQGMLCTLPQLLADHEPSIHSLPEFVFHLATRVNWEEEEPCFDGVAQVLARYYSEIRYPGNIEREALVLEHVLFPATKLATFCPPNELNHAQLMTPVACLTNLYKIFERC